MMLENMFIIPFFIPDDAGEHSDAAYEGSV
jgi:hypothetical protein